MYPRVQAAGALPMTQLMTSPHEDALSITFDNPTILFSLLCPSAPSFRRPGGGAVRRPGAARRPHRAQLPGDALRGAWVGLRHHRVGQPVLRRCVLRIVGCSLQSVVELVAAHREPKRQLTFNLVVFVSCRVECRPPHHLRHGDPAGAHPARQQGRRGHQAEGAVKKLPR